MVDLLRPWPPTSFFLAEVLDVGADHEGLDAFDLLDSGLLAALQKLAHSAQVGAAGVLVVDGGHEEVEESAPSSRPGPLHEHRKYVDTELDELAPIASYGSSWPSVRSAGPSGGCLSSLTSEPFRSGSAVSLQGDVAGQSRSHSMFAKSSTCRVRRLSRWCAFCTVLVTSQITLVTQNCRLSVSQTPIPHA